jgi:hypothetical protein
MSDWPRKYLCDLVRECKRLAADPTLAPDQRREFVEAHKYAKQWASFPGAGCPVRLSDAIVRTCSACIGINRYNCEGRTDWQAYCPLLSSGD